jgi:hypothetical protein
MKQGKRMNKILKNFLISISILIYIYMLIRSKSISNSIFNDKINFYSTQNLPNRKLNIFFDLGANKGDSVLNFLNINPTSQGGNINKEERFNLTLETNEWIIYLFEANKFFDDKLVSVKNEIEKLNHKVFLNSQTAAWTSDGIVDFYLDTVNKEADYWGSSLNSNHVNFKIVFFF